MSLQLILGSSGSGKTYYTYQSMINQSIKESGSSILLIVPEQFTLQTQQDIINMHPRKGIMNIEVLSFQRLAFRIYDDLAIANKTMLKDTGKSMAIRKIVEEQKNDFKIIHKNINKKGYVKELKDLITEFYQYNFNQEAFDKINREISHPMLLEKINDVQLLYYALQDYLSRKYITTETLIDLLPDAINSSDFLSDATIYIDGFYGFTPIQYKNITELMKKAKDVNVAITIDSKEKIDDLEDESQLFYESKKAINKLINIVEEEHIDLKEHIFIEDEQPHRFINNEALAHLEKNLYRYPYNRYKGKISSLFLCQAPNIRKEVKYIADSIMKLVMHKGYRFKDISVVTGDIEGYENALKLIFAQYEIPYFIDQKKAVIGHPLVELLLSAMEVVTRDYSYDSMFRYIKSGLLDFNHEDIDRLENYVLAYGIRGYNTWNKDWQRAYPLIRFDSTEGYAKEIIENINKVKNKIIEPINSLRDAIKVKDVNVVTITKAIYRFFEQLKVEERLARLEEQFEKNGQLLLQKEYTSIYKLIIDMLDQMVEILGDDKINPKAYAKLLQAGLEECKMGLVPPGLDQVVVGDLERTRTRETKALFVMGLNDGKVPKVFDKPNLLTDRERTVLSDIGIEMAPDNKRNIFKEQFSIYMGLLRVTDKLYLSFAKSNTDGKSIRPSILFNNIKKIFPDITVVNIENLYSERFIVNKPKPTFWNIIYKLNHSSNLEEEHKVKQAYKWFYKQENWQNKLVNAEEAIYHRNDESHLDHEMVDALYGNDLSSSVSRLETFSKCPFTHFIDYGLKLKERPEYVVKMPDIGILFHKSIDRFSKKLAHRNISWSALDDTLRDTLVDETVEEVVKEEQRGIFLSTSRNIYLIKRLTRIVKRAIWAIKYQITKGEFKPVAYEYAFDGSKEGLEALTINFDNHKTMKLRGQIDRLDQYENQDNMYLSVVDYKSGNKSFDMVALYYGLQLQLLLYLNSATELKTKQTTKKVVPAGVFYFHIDDPIVKDVTERTPEVIERSIINQLKLKGLVLDDREIISKLDASFTRSSDVIPVMVTSKGDLAKSSSTISKETFKCLQKYVKEKTVEIGHKIVNGDISISPYKRKKETSCDYCSYMSICQFEHGIKGNTYRYLSDMKDDEVLEKIDKCVEKNHGGDE